MMWANAFDVGGRAIYPSLHRRPRRTWAPVSTITWWPAAGQKPWLARVRNQRLRICGLIYGRRANRPLSSARPSLLRITTKMFHRRPSRILRRRALTRPFHGGRAKWPRLSKRQSPSRRRIWQLGLKLWRPWLIRRSPKWIAWRPRRIGRWTEEQPIRRRLEASKPSLLNSLTKFNRLRVLCPPW